MCQALPPWVSPKEVQGFDGSSLARGVASESGESQGCCRDPSISPHRHTSVIRSPHRSPAETPSAGASGRRSSLADPRLPRGITFWR